jgi:hypothetical protein
MCKSFLSNSYFDYISSFNITRKTNLNHQISNPLACKTTLGYTQPNAKTLRRHILSKVFSAT